MAELWRKQNSIQNTQWQKREENKTVSRTLNGIKGNKTKQYPEHSIAKKGRTQNSIQNTQWQKKGRKQNSIQNTQWQKREEHKTVSRTLNGKKGKKTKQYPEHSMAQKEEIPC